MKKILERVIKNGSNILNESSYKKAGVTIPIIEESGTLSIIVEKRAQNIAQAGEISFPGGKFEEADANLEETAIRETCEELNIDESNIETIGTIGTIVTRISYIIEVFPVYIKNILIKDINYNRDEVEEIFAIPFSYFMCVEPDIYKINHRIDLENREFFELNIPERYKKDWGGAKGEIYVYHYQGEVIWGVTAEIIYHFVKQLKASLSKK